MKGMIISCGGCGKLKSFDLDASPEVIEYQVHSTIEHEGWRYVKAWGDYICRDCRKHTQYEALLGKPKAESKVNSYKELMGDVLKQMMSFKELEG